MVFFYLFVVYAYLFLFVYTHTVYIKKMILLNRVVTNIIAPFWMMIQARFLMIQKLIKKRKVNQGIKFGNILDP